MSRLSYLHLNDELARRVPELAGGLNRLRQSWAPEEPGPHVVYGDLLVPFLAGAARVPIPQATLKEAMELLEEMISTFDDGEIKNVAGASVLETLSGDSEAWPFLRPLMGPYTTALAEQIEGG